MHDLIVRIRYIIGPCYASLRGIVFMGFSTSGLISFLFMCTGSPDSIVSGELERPYSGRQTPSKERS